MSARTHSRAGSKSASSTTRTGALLQRKCACGSSTESLTGECTECSGKKYLQTKLAIGASHDPLEREADRVADQVLTAPSHSNIEHAPPRIQRAASHASSHAAQAPPSVDRALSGSGSPLEPALRQDMEQRFSHDFSRVRVHTGAMAAQSARDVSARAYTVGNSIVFDSGRFAPRTQEGRRLLAHELTHVVQQSGANVIRREVAPASVSNASEVLRIIKQVVDSNGKGKKPAEANLIRLAELGLKFNPGAAKEEENNKFVYTCRCGWIDMGHFFISAAAAYGVGYQRKRLELRVGGKPHSIEEALTGATNKLTPLLEQLLKTVPDNQGAQVLSDLRKLLASGEPRDIGLAFGYWMEFVQQVAKLIADPGSAMPEPLKEQLKGVLAQYQQLLMSSAPEKLKVLLEGSARSAFTMEDLPSDCYGAALGQDVWKQSDGLKQDRDLPQIHALMTTFLADCGAVFAPEGSKTRCEMLEETTPGSCPAGSTRVGEKGPGEPARHGATKPRLLNSAKPLCGEASTPKPCRSGTGAPSAPIPSAIADISDKGLTIGLTGNIPLHQPKPRYSFGGDVTVAGRPERCDRKDPLTLSGPSFVRVTPRGNVIAYSTLSGVPGAGDLKLGTHFDPGLGRYGKKGNLGFRGRLDVQAQGILGLDVEGKLDIDLSELLKGIAGPELQDLKAVLTSGDFTTLAKQVFTRDISLKEFLREVKALLKKKFPQGSDGVIDMVLWRLKNMEALAAATRLEAQGTVRVAGIPISGFLVHKSFGLQPVLGLEGGLVLSELQKGRTIVGAKGWLYGENILQAQLTAGIDPFGRKAIAELHLVNKTLTGNKLTFDVRYQINPAGEQQFLVLFGGELNRFGSK